MFKILRSDDASDFDEIGYQFFNTTGGSWTLLLTHHLIMMILKNINILLMTWMSLSHFQLRL